MEEECEECCSIGGGWVVRVQRSGGCASVSDSMVMAELPEFQFPGSRESGGTLTLATKTSAVRHWLLREEQERSAQKPWTYKSSVHLSPHQKKNFKVIGDGKFKNSLRWLLCPLSRSY